MQACGCIAAQVFIPQLKPWHPPPPRPLSQVFCSHKNQNRGLPIVALCSLPLFSSRFFAMPTSSGRSERYHSRFPRSHPRLLALRFSAARVVRRAAVAPPALFVRQFSVLFDGFVAGTAKALAAPAPAARAEVDVEVQGQQEAAAAPMVVGLQVLGARPLLARICSGF
jgi:hypothetical protein